VSFFHLAPVQVQSLSNGRRRCRERERAAVKKKGFIWGFERYLPPSVLCCVLLVNVGNFGAVMEYYAFTRICFYFAE